jgi:FtsH-binding integral membrane protein
MQKIKRNLIQNSFGDSETLSKISIMGALELYLDFVNLFLNLLRIFGKKR